MLINKEYSHDRRLLHRTGLAVERHTLRQEHEAFHVIKWVMALLMAMVLMASCDQAFAGEHEVIASVIAAEACGEGVTGMEMVANTISNRAAAWYKTPYQVVTAKNQYYGYTAANRNRLYLSCQAVADRLAQAILAGGLPDKTGGALYFLREGERIRAWHGERTITYKQHTFYRGAQ